MIVVVALHGKTLLFGRVIRMYRTVGVDMRMVLLRTILMVMRLIVGRAIATRGQTKQDDRKKDNDKFFVHFFALLSD